LGISSEALFARTAKLPRVEIKDPGKVIGTNTVTHIQAGLYYGAVDMVDGMFERGLRQSFGKDAAVVATGGQASLVARGSKHIQHTDEFLTLTGLRIIWSKNQGAEPGKASGPRKWVRLRKSRNCRNESRGTRRRLAVNAKTWMAGITSITSRKSKSISGRNGARNLLVSPLDWAIMETCNERVCRWKRS